MNGLLIELSFEGKLADRNQIDFYDASRALIGFQRSLALTVHAVVNNETIVQAPSLKNASIILLPAEAGSWKTKALITVGAGIWALGGASKDSLFGNIVFSAYDYVISESLGVHVDYDQSIIDIYEKNQRKEGKNKRLTQGRLDSVIEKSESAIRDMHRPIVFSATAKTANISAEFNKRKESIGPALDIKTYDYISYSEKTEKEDSLHGYVSSYNSNTFQGRIYVEEEGRPDSFDLSERARGEIEIELIVNSLRANALERFKGAGRVEFSALKVVGKAGQLKRYFIIDVRRSV